MGEYCGRKHVCVHLCVQAADYLAVGISELASISERRTERLVNHHLSGPRLKPEGDGKGSIPVP